MSSNGTTWSAVASGTWPDTVAEKTVSFTAVSARYVRLTATSEAGNRGPWSSAAEINLLGSTPGSWGPGGRRSTSRSSRPRLRYCLATAS